jgi:endonuclease/exonuclease/phosphatase family metal-dependent hydrolase
VRIATFNFENLFSRPTAMADNAGAAGTRAIADHAELNRIIAKPVYAETDRKRLVTLGKRYGLDKRNPPRDAFVFLNKIRGQLYSLSNAGVLSVVATGRADWTGWFELRRADVSWRATYNTARAIAAAEHEIEILVCVEAENRPTAVRFNEQVLGAQFARAFPHVMVIDGNDDRGIDVGILSRHPIESMRSHVDDRDAAGNRIFSRDCPAFTIALPAGPDGDTKRLVVLANHFKSKRGGDNPADQALRRRQAERAHAIARAAETTTPLVLIAGDLNDTPDSAPLAPLWADGYSDVITHPDYPQDRPGTYETGLASHKFDYLIMSPALRAKLETTGIERRGSYHPRTWEPFDTVERAADEASDHHLVWADFDL